MPGAGEGPKQRCETIFEFFAPPAQGQKKLLVGLYACQTAALPIRNSGREDLPGENVGCIGSGELHFVSFVSRKPIHG